MILLYALTAPTAFAQENTLLFLAEELPPYHYLNEKGQVTGALVDIVNATLKQAELNGEVKIQPFARSYQAAQNQTNTFLFSLLKTPKRIHSFQWVGETYKSYAVLVGLKKKKTLQLASLDNAKHYLVGTIRGYHSAQYLKENGFKENKNLSLSVTSKHMWAKLFSNRIDFVLTNFMALDRDITNAGFNAENIKPYLSIKDFPNELNIATGLTTPKDTVERLRVALNDIKQSGIYQKILTQYDLQ